jgi:hypothetical protein
MSATVPGHVYEVFGLRLSLPEGNRLLPPAGGDTPAEVGVSYGAAPLHLPRIVSARRMEDMKADIEVGANEEVLWTTAAARYLVTGGHSIIIEVIQPGTPWGRLQRFVLFYCLPAALIQRGQLALHANAVATPAGAVVIAGSSGAGKSTLLAALLKKGGAMLSDDVTVMSTRRNGRPSVEAGFPLYRLCGDALEQIGPAADRITALGGPRAKFAVRAPASDFQAKAVPLQAIYFLSVHEGDSVEVEPVQGIDKLFLLEDQSYAPLSLRNFPRQILLLTDIVGQVPVFRVRRPRAHQTVDELVALVTKEGG